MIRWLSPKPAGLLLELVVVIAGVLIALAADSWWEGREASRTELAYLTALATDLETATVAVEEDIATVETWIAEIGDFGTWLESERPWGGGTVPEIQVVSVQVPTGTLESLVATGDVNLIRDPALRAAIVRELSTIQSALADRGIYVEASASTAWSFAEALQELRTDGERGPFQTFPELRSAPPELVRRDPTLSAVFIHHDLTLRNDLDVLRQISRSVKRLQSAVASAREAPE